MRATWDPVVDTEDAQAFYESYRVAPTVRKGQGFSQQDFALRDASWAVSRVISDRAGDRGKREGFEAAIEPDNSLAPEKIAVEDPSAMSHKLDGASGSIEVAVVQAFNNNSFALKLLHRSRH